MVVPTAATGMDCRRIWEVRASEVLSDRERGLLPNEHPVQRVSPQVRVVVSHLAIFYSNRRSRSCSTAIFIMTLDALLRDVRLAKTTSISSGQTSTRLIVRAPRTRTNARFTD